MDSSFYRKYLALLTGRASKDKPLRIGVMLFLAMVSGAAFIAAWPNGLRADTEGANSPSTAVNDTGIGSEPWTGPGNVTGSEDTRATVTMSSNSTPSNYIKATGFGFSIPAGSTINGIVAEVERSEGSTDGNNGCVDNAVRIVKGGTIGSTDQSAGGDWPAADAYATYGNSTYKWGDTWMVSDINASDFGFAISAANSRSGGNPNNTEVCRVDHIRITVHYTPPPSMYDQSSYRWFNNDNSTDVGSVLADQDTAATIPVKDTAFRLRLALHVSNWDLSQSGQDFKLQFAKKGGGSCASPGEAYADVTTTSAIQYYDNASASDGAALTTNANDPQHSTHTTRAQTYEEANDFTNSQAAISVGEDGLWDFALVDDSADYGANYCFKAVLSGGSDIDSYGVYPEITTAAAPTIDQSAYRWFEHQAANQGFDDDGILDYTEGSFIARSIAKDSNNMYVVGDASGAWRIEKRALSDGELDNGFGSSGVVSVSSSAFWLQQIAIDSTYMYVVGSKSPNPYGWRIEKRALSDGELDNGFGSSGVVSVSSSVSTHATDIAIDSTYMYVVGNGGTSGLDWRIEKRALSDGGLDNGFGSSGGIAGDSATGGDPVAQSLEIDSTYMYVVGRTGDVFNWRIEKRALSDGELDSNFGSSGVVTGDSASRVADDIMIDGTYMYVVGTDDNNDWRIEKRALSDGSVDSGFGTSGVVTGDSASNSAYAVAIDSTYMYVVGEDENFDWRIEKRALSDGELDSNFGSSGVVTGDSASRAALAIAIDGSYMYVAGRSGLNDWRIEKRALSDGALDTATADVGSALAAQDTAATLTSTGQAFRLRMDLHVNTNKLKTSGQDFKLQVAKKGTGTCASPEFSYADVSSGSGDIRYNDTGNDGISLTDNANDPVHSSHTNNNQTYEEANNFTNSESAIPAGEDGLWDFALVDDSAPGDTAYCFKAVDSGGSALNSYGVYPEITTFADTGPSTTADIVDAAGDPVTSPSFALNAHTLSFSCESVTGTFGTSSQRVRVTNGFTAENWSLTLAATDGPAATWSGGPSDYDFNDDGGNPAGCEDGTDDDSLSGQMSLDPSAGTLSPKSGCTNTGVTKGSSNSFVEGTANDLTILSGTTASDTDCYWDLTGMDVDQQIPADQPTGSYSLNLTLTLTVL